MKKSILSDVFPTEARTVSKFLIASLEQLEAIDQLDETKSKVIEDATTLAQRIKHDYRDNPELQDDMARVLAGLGAADVVVSNESLAGLIGKLSGFWRKRKPDSKHMPDEERSTWRERDEALKKFIMEMDKTYLNQNWMSKQKFVVGDISATDFSGNLELDGKPVKDPEKNIDEHLFRLEMFIEKWFKPVSELAKQVDAIHERTVKAAMAVKGEEGVKIVKAATKELNALPDPLKTKFPKLEGTFLRNAVPKVNDKGHVSVINDPTPKPVETLPALDKESAMKIAKLIKRLCQPGAIPDMPWLKFLDFKDGSAFSDWIYDEDYDAYEAYYWRFYWQGAHQQWTDFVWDLTDVYRICSSLIKWIDRSIK